MKVEIELPSRIPVMTLNEVAFFPQVMMPLFIFEERYRKMLSFCLDRHRMFAVAGLKSEAIELGFEEEPAHEVATIGMIRACQTHDDGTSHLILQGLSRVKLAKIFEDKPYREADIVPLKSRRNINRDDLTDKRDRLMELIHLRSNLKQDVPAQLIPFIDKLKDPDQFVDLVAYAIIADPILKQKILATLEVDRRYDILISAVAQDLDQIQGPGDA